MFGPGDTDENVYLGKNVLSSPSLTGGWNVAIGTDALSSNTTGDYGTSVGRWSLKNNTSGQQNSAFGVDAMWGNTTGDANVAIGTHAMVFADTGSNNVAVGKAALTGAYSGVSPNEVGAYSGNDCVAIGADTLSNNISGSGNVAVGRQAGLSLTTGATNTHLGTNSGYTNGGAHATTTGNNQVYVGNLSGQGVTTATQIDNAVAIGYNAQVLASNSCQIGDLSMTNFRFGNDLILASTTGITTVTDNASGFSLLTAVNTNANGYARLDLTASTGGVGSSTTISHSPSFFAKWLTSSNDVVQIVAATNGVQLASGGTSWTSLSDERQKDIIEPISNASEKLATLRTVIGKYKTDDSSVRRSFLIAQDVQAVLPEAISNIKPDKDSEDTTEYLGLSYTDVIPLLVAAINEIKADFDTYKETHP
jgi:trimeric autotransporter adhesin